MKKTLICVVVLLSALNVTSVVLAETPEKGVADNKRPRPLYADLVRDGGYHVVAVTPPYIWMEFKTGAQLFVCKYNQEKPWEVSNRCSMARDVPKDLD